MTTKAFFASSLRRGLTMTHKPISVEVLIDLKRRLAAFAPRSHERRTVIAEAAHVYGVSEKTIYRALARQSCP